MLYICIVLLAKPSLCSYFDNIYTHMKRRMTLYIMHHVYNCHISRHICTALMRLTLSQC